MAPLLFLINVGRLSSLTKQANEKGLLTSVRFGCDEVHVIMHQFVNDMVVFVEPSL